MQFLLENNPLFKTYMEIKKGHVQTAGDSFHVFRNPNQHILIPPMFEKYPNSPTAQRYLKAFYHFLDGWNILTNYRRDTVESEDDYNLLKVAFGCYAAGEMAMQHLFSQFFPPEYTRSLIKQCLKRQPDDPILNFFDVVLKFNKQSVPEVDGDTSNFEIQKLRIVEGEEFVHQILTHAELSDLHKSMLIHIYEILGAMYVTTKQHRRALDSFQKWYDLDPTDPEAIYGIAYQYMVMKENEKAIELLKKYVALSPVCAKHYPNAYYLLSYLYWLCYQNKDEAMKYCSLAEEAEKQRLDFLYPVDIEAKQIMLAFKSVFLKTKTMTSSE